MHLGFVDPVDGKPYDFKFDNKDTDNLAMFLYPRACAIVATRKLVAESSHQVLKRVIMQEYLDQKTKDCELRREMEHGSTPCSGTTENERGKG